MLDRFITAHRQELIERTRSKVALRSAPRATDHELDSGIPFFLDQLAAYVQHETSRGAVDTPEMQVSAAAHGRKLLEHGFSIGQVVHDYGDVCQAVTELALDLRIPMSTEAFQVLNRCLDNAIASAVTEYARQREVDLTKVEVLRQGFFAHELRNHLGTAILTFQAVRSGRVGVAGSTVAVLERSLRGMRDLIDRSVSEVRLDSGSYFKERLPVLQFIEEMEIDAAIATQERAIQFSVERAGKDLVVVVDRQLFASAISNIVHNAFKFTRRSGRVSLKVRSTSTHVSIDVEDECGGLPPGASERMFRPFEQLGVNRSGLGLGLAISRRAVEVDGGTLTVRDIPGKGCAFTVEMPLAVGVLDAE